MMTRYLFPALLGLVGCAILISLGLWINHVVGTQHKHHIGGRELRVDHIHLLELLIGHIGLSKKHIHMTRHPSRNRMNGIGDLGTISF